MSKQNEIIIGIDHLIEICNERKQGYKKAAADVKDPELKAVFEKYSKQSFNFSQDLLHYSDKKSAAEVGTRIIADTWRLWMDIKSVLTNGGSSAILDACLTGEEAAIRNYNQVLEGANLPAPVKEKIRQQLSEITAAYKKIKELSDKESK